MTHRSLFASLVFVSALALPMAASAQHGGRIDVPEVPSNLVVPEGNVPFMQTRAYGTQQYVCLPTGWKQFGPQATLYPQNAPVQIATHFLSANPVENGTPRPTWQHADDGSTVWGRLYTPTSSAPGANGSIPWLLLEAAGTADGPIGGEVFTKTTFIQRLNTDGGAAPAGACGTVGATLLVPYSTDYFFYRAEK